MHRIDQATKKSAKNHWGIIRFQDQIISSCQWNQPIYIARIAHNTCERSLTQEGSENLILSIYLNSSKSWTKTMGKLPIISHLNNELFKYSGNNIATIPKKPRYVNIPIIVGTGFLVFFRSLPGLSKISNFLKPRIHKNVTILAPRREKNRFISVC